MTTKKTPSIHSGIRFFMCVALLSPSLGVFNAGCEQADIEEALEEEQPLDVETTQEAMNVQFCNRPRLCVQCVLEKRTDILPFYQQNGWDISTSNHNKIVDNWCDIDPAGCGNVKNNQCSSVCLMRDSYNYRSVCPNPAGGRWADQDIDAWNFYKCECTSYVADKLNENGIPFTNQYLGVERWGHARDWLPMARTLAASHPDKLSVPTTPMVGDVAVWTSGEYGHVAHVVRVYPDNYIDICEYNGGRLYDFKCRHHVRAHGYIRFYTNSITQGKTLDSSGNTIGQLSNSSWSEAPLVPCKTQQAEQYWGTKGIDRAGTLSGSCNAGKSFLVGYHGGDLAEYRVWFPDPHWTYQFHVIGHPDAPGPVPVNVYVDGALKGTVNWDDTPSNCDEGEGGFSHRLSLSGYTGVHNIAFEFAQDYNNCSGGWSDDCDRNFKFDYFKMNTI